jgi:hypothetical protein
VVKRSGAVGPANAYLPQLALRAVSDLLPALLTPGATVDLRALSERKTSAIANFLLGEREYRRMQFDAALGHYRDAVQEDSAFAIAAFKGAQTATWLSRPDVDSVFAQVALRRAQYLTPPQTLLVKGLRAYVGGAADSAVTYLRAALRADSTPPGAWTLLGEVYARSLTSEPAADSLAHAALRRARALDPGFAPTLVLLEEMALRDGDISAARQFKSEIARAGADTTHATERTLIWRCVERGAGSIDWSDAARLDPLSVLAVGRVLVRAGPHASCARSALRAVFASDSSVLGVRHGALLALNGLLLSDRRIGELRTLLVSRRAADLRIGQLYLQDAATGQGFEAEADAARDSLGPGYTKLRGPTLWLLGGWAARRGALSELSAITRAARERADSSELRADRLVASALEARLTVVKGDTAKAIAQLRALKPNAARRDIAWLPSEGLGAERLLLAQLLFAQRQYGESVKMASLLDANEPVPYLLYLRPSLDLRIRAANALGDLEGAKRYAKRLELLVRPLVQ